MATLLFVGHEASRTGAPFTQLHLINWIKANTTHDIVVVMLWGGELEAEFAKVARVHVLDKGKVPKTISERALAKLNRITQYERKQIFKKIAASNPVAIFGNSAMSLPLSVELKVLLKVPLVFNVHELENTFFFFSKDNFARDSAHIDYLIPGSFAVKEYMESFCLTPKERIGVVYDFIESEPQGNTTAEEIRRLHQIPATARVVGAIGSLVWRKGADIFVQVARTILETAPDTYFIWVGGSPDSYQYKEMARDVRLMGLSHRVLFVGGKSDLRGYYEAFDVFLLTSREDPFPLVCLEAGLAGTPTVCFADAGGMPEFVRDDAGAVVPYLDVAQMAAETQRLLQSPALIRQQGLIAQQRVKEHHTIKTIGPAMFAIIEQMIAQSRT
ncbi:glycosyltransferase family 4 protein [Hymenobacter sp. B1770]|uniref:glycosyltransferase family 4 protein n=1 Tax=Hymenobacter sp. B1770 TaxID=1718788 RepID=UPI003CF43851